MREASFHLSVGHAVDYAGLCPATVRHTMIGSRLGSGQLVYLVYCVAAAGSENPTAMGHSLPPVPYRLLAQRSAHCVSSGMDMMLR